MTPHLPNITLPLTATVREAIGAIDRGAKQIALVVDGAERLVGTVTDGDVRRGLLRGEGFESPVERVMYREFRRLGAEATAQEALSLMRREVVHQVPALDEEGRVVRLFLLEELLKPRTRPNPVLLMAGGEGRRLRPLTEETPKPMLPVGGKPMLERILEQCVDAGFREFWISVHYLKERIQEYFGDGSRWEVAIRYLEEDQPMGTAGALGLLPERPAAPLLVMNGDVLTRVDFGSLLRFHEEHRSAATLCVREHATQIPYGVVQMDDTRVLRLEEKPVVSHYVNAGLYLLNPEILDLLPAAPESCDMPTLFEKAMASSLPVNAFPIHEYWLDVGHPETLDRANGEWA